MTSTWVCRHGGISYHCTDRAAAEAMVEEFKTMGVYAVVVLVIRGE